MRDLAEAASARPRRRRARRARHARARASLPRITEWHDDSPISREVVRQRPRRRSTVAFYATVATMLFVVAWLVSLRVRNYERGEPDDRRTNRRATSTGACATSAPACGCRRCCATPPPASCTRCIYFGFLVLFIATVDARDRPPAARRTLKFLHGDDVPGVRVRAPTSRASCSSSASCGRSAAATSQRPYRIRIKTKPEDAVILGTFLVIGVTGFFTEALRIALERPARRSRSGRSSATRSRRSFDTLVGRARSATRTGGCGASTSLAFLAFLVILPTTKLRHMITSPMNMYLKRPRPAQGRDEAHAEPDGDRARDVRRVDDRGLHLEAAVRHRRVHDLRTLHVGVPGARDRQAARPARDRAEGRRGDGRDRRPRRCRRRSASTATSRSPPTACSSASRPRSCGRARSCKACDEICPVNIEILDKILDMRRYLSLMESDFPAELGNTYRSMENSANVYGMNQGERGDWAESLEGVEIVEPGGAVRPRVPLLGRLRGQLRRPQQEDEPRASRSCCSAPASTSRSSARASCAPATRPAARATSTSSRCSRCRTSRRSTAWACKKIITQCPHCFNTLKNEYPQLGGNYEVVHHSQLLDAARRRRPALARGRVARRARHVPRLLLPRPPQRRVPRAAQRRSARSPASTSSRCRATAPRACAAAPAARACGWRRTSARR